MAVLSAGGPRACLTFLCRLRCQYVDRELSIFAEQVVVLGDHRNFSDGSAAGSPSGLVAPLGEIPCDFEHFSSTVIKLNER